MDNKKIVKWFLIVGVVLALVVCMELSYNINHRGLTINPYYMFNNFYLLVGCLTFGVAPGLCVMVNTITNYSIKRDNYSTIATKSDYKKKMPILYFDRNADIQIPEHVIERNQKFEEVNEWLHDHHIDFFKLPVKNVNARCGLPFITAKNHIYADTSDSHTLIVGTSGSGKSYSFMLPMLCFMAISGESGLCVDIKGELSESTAELFRSKGYDVYFIDFIDPDNSDCWNPLYLGAREYMKQLEIDKKEKQQYKMNLENEIKEFEILRGNVATLDPKSFFGKNNAGDYIYETDMESIKTSADFSVAQEYLKDAVLAITEGKKNENRDSFWDEEAGRILEGYVHLLVETGNIDVVNIPAVSRVMLDGDEIKRKTSREEVSFLQYYLNNFKDNTQLSKQRLMPYVDSAEQTRKSSRNVLTKHLSSIVTNDAIKKMLSHNDIDLENIGDKKTMIFLKVHDEKQTYYPLVTLFIKQLWQCLVKSARNSGGRLPIPFNIMFDEMGQFPSFKEITNVLTAGRSRGVRLTAVVQGFDQLKEAYGDNTATTIKNNVMNTVYLLSGDYNTLDELSKRCGTKPVYRNGTHDPVPIITVDRLKNFKMGEALILRQREGPYIAKMLPFNKYVFYDSLVPYELQHKLKREPKYFDLKAEIVKKEEK